MYSFSLCAQGRVDGVLKVSLSPELAPNIRGSSVLCSEKDTGRLCRETPMGTEALQRGVEWHCGPVGVRDAHSSVQMFVSQGPHLPLSASSTLSYMVNMPHSLPS